MLQTPASKLTWSSGSERLINATIDSPFKVVVDNFKSPSTPELTRPLYWQSSRKFSPAARSSTTSISTSTSASGSSVHISRKVCLFGLSVARLYTMTRRQALTKSGPTNNPAGLSPQQASVYTKLQAYKMRRPKSRSAKSKSPKT